MTAPSALSRRGLLVGMTATLVTAPAIVRAASLMPVRGLVMPVEVYGRSPGMMALEDMFDWSQAMRDIITLGRGFVDENGRHVPLHEVFV